MSIERPCRACGAAAVPFGQFCARCYGEWLHPDGQPLEPGDPADPWRAFNAEADALILDRKMPAHLLRDALPRPCRPPAFDDDLPFDPPDN